MAETTTKQFGNLALLTRSVRKEHLQECLELQRTTQPGRNIGELLLERGYISKEQLNIVIEARRKQDKKHLAGPEELAGTDRAFGQIAVSLGLLTLDALEEAVLEQQRLRSVSLQFCLGEILVARGQLTVEDVIGILARQGKLVLACPLCELHFNVITYQADKRYSCPSCGAALVRPKFLETVAVDGVIEA